MKYYVDRIEDGFAVMDNDSGESITVSVDILPVDVREGSVLQKKPDGSFERDEQAELKRKKSLFDRFNRLKNGGKQ